MSLLSRLAVQAARAYGILSSADKTKVAASYLVVAGGGGGGSGGGSGGGGGAGGLLTSTFTLSTLNTYSIAVGSGGAGAVNTTSIASSGTSSSISGTGLSTVTTVGGGGGASDDVNFPQNTGGNGGSGGGGGGGGTGGSTGGTGTAGQGNNGGYSTAGGSRGGGGGGGSGSAGSIATNANGANGGSGTASSISGSSVTYAGGGGGGTQTGTAGTATGGGGAGSVGNTSATAGTANTGGGGGGRGFASGGAAGGSGIVIISYASATPKFVGGTLTTSGGNQIHTFTSSGTLSPLTPVTASYLVVAGGGGSARQLGGYAGNGGGGAGGLLSGSTTLYSGATYVVTVGAGGAGGTSSGVAPSGSNSVLSGTGLTTLTSTGGGGGGGSTGTGANGGSGGGGSGESPRTAGTGTAGQGNNGGAGVNGGGGGGGAGAAGSVAVTITGGAGGIGVQSSITGTATYYAGGGGGGAYSSGSAGTGGQGGGGNGGAGASNTGNTPGTQNTGGGAGGTAGDPLGATNGQSGGSGIVIISYTGSQLFNGGLVTSSGGNTIHTFTATGALTPLTNNLNNSLRFRRSNNAYLSRTPTVAGNQKTWTYSAWVKRGLLGSIQDIWHANGPSTTENDYFAFDSDTLQLRIKNSNSVVCELITTQVFRDPSAWYHIVAVWDSTQATAANRVKLYVNGNQITAFSTATYPSQNTNTNSYNSTVLHTIGTQWYNSTLSNYLDGYMTDINFIDGQALEPYYFGNNDANGVWKPIKYTGTYGTNGFYLTFGNTTSTTTLGNDSSGNGNNWTTNNISLTAGTTYDAMTDVPTNTSATVANYCTLNPLESFTSPVPQQANLYFNGADYSQIKGTFWVSTGKWYFEWVSISGSLPAYVGVSNASITSNTNVTTSGISWYGHSNSYYKNFTGTSLVSVSAISIGDIIGVAFDCDAGTVAYYKNNTLVHTDTTLTPNQLVAPTLIATFSGGGWSPAAFNFGQRPFAYTPPTGFVALNTFNLPTPTILQGNKYMDATLWTGNGSLSRTITNAALFKPDLIWNKDRTTAYSHRIVDSVRGVRKELYSNTTDQELDQWSTYGSVNSFDSNGFTLTTGGTAGNFISNLNGDAQVAWQWQAGQGSTSSNTSGSITSTVSVNTTAGFSIVTYTGNNTASTVGHGLGVGPKMIIVKSRSATNPWPIYHADLGVQRYIFLNATDAAYNNLANYWGSTAPSSTTFGIGAYGGINANAATYVAYCWAEIAGFSRFGSYTGNGSADGPFVATNFAPKFVMIKRTDAANDWNMYDSRIGAYNVITDLLKANTSAAQTNYYTYGIDFLSNGFKLRETDTGQNASGGTYIFMAFASNPFKSSNAR